MSDDAMREIHAHDLQMSKDMGVPHHLYENSPEFIDWYGRFTVRINGREFKMAVTPSTLFVNESDSSGPVAQLTGSEWLETPVGRLFHADYVTSMVHGGFQVFRKEDASPFDGFESVQHTHMLVYTDGAGQKQFFPVVVSFANK
jgi:hypothetical protein